MIKMPGHVSLNADIRLFFMYKFHHCPEQHLNQNLIIIIVAAVQKM